MKALVISDTHVKRREDIGRLNKIIEPFIDGVDIIIHAGDSVTVDLVNYLKELKPTHIVSGNMDTGDVVWMLPDRIVFDFGHFRIGLTHGDGPASGLKERVFEKFINDRVDAIIFGHSHQPYIEKRDNVLLLNPGSPTDTRFADRNTVMVLEGDGELKAEIVDV